MSGPDAELAVRRVWKAEAPRVIGGLARLLRDVALAEDFAQEAVLAALEEWPRTGVPDRPGAWLMTTARNRALNAIRRNAMVERTGSALALDDGRQPSPSELEAALADSVDRDVRDDVLRLLFTACHPVLTQEARVTLTLRVVGGLSTEEIARAFLTTEPTIAQRVVRAKRALGEASLPFEVPSGAELRARLPSVLEVLYLVFNEGHTATVGVELIRPDLTNEALRLAQLLAELLPGEPEAQGLLALMRSARLARTEPDRRTGRSGAPRGAGPISVGRGADRRRPRRPRASRVADDDAGALPAASDDRRLSRPRSDGRRYRLESHRRASTETSGG